MNTHKYIAFLILSSLVPLNISAGDFAELSDDKKRALLIEFSEQKTPDMLCNQPDYAECLGISKSRCMHEVRDVMKACTQKLGKIIPKSYEHIDVKEVGILYGQCAVREQINGVGYPAYKLNVCGGL